MLCRRPSPAVSSTSRTDAVVSVGWVPLAKVAEVQTDSFRVEWNLTLANELGVGRAAVVARLEPELADPATKVQWG